MLKVALLMAVSWMANASDFREAITVRVYNLVGARAGVIAKGEQEASYVFRWAGIAVRWVDCRAVDPSRTGNQACVEPGTPYTFTVVIADRFANTSIKDTALGFAIPFSRNRNYVGISIPV
jgi:hypothetical protein